MVSTMHVYLCDVMLLRFTAFYIYYYVYYLLLHCSCLWLILSVCNYVMMDEKYKNVHIIINT